MPHALTELKLNAVTKPAKVRAHEIRADVCVVGAGIAGLSRSSSPRGWAGTWCWSTPSR
jgi:hypothetical protein